MKDLYTFDATEDAALETYERVKEAYVRLFKELKIPFLVAEADSGTMGGTRSHEFHFVTPIGEDNILDCPSCNRYVANEEKAVDVINQKESICPQCRAGKLRIRRAVELGHTFHLGTRYSKPLNATVGESESSLDRRPIFMGCHGVGISRMIGAVASKLSDDKGLNWPALIAPYQVVIIPGGGTGEDTVIQVHDKLNSHAEGSKSSDIVIDDRQSTLIQKLKDADLIGYPVIVVLGKQWIETRRCEVQCRRLNVKTFVPLRELKQKVGGLLRQL